MTSRAQYQRNAARRSLHQMPRPELVEDAPLLSPLQRLELETVELVRSLKTREQRLQQDKRSVLRNIYLIYTEHFQELEEKYQKDLALYIEERIEVQDRKTALSDAKIIEMLQTHGSAGLLELDVRGMLYSLRRIAYLRDANDPERALGKQRELLGQIQALSREELELSLKLFREQTRRRNLGQTALPLQRPWQQKLDRRNHRIVLSQIPEERLEKLNRLLLHLDDSVLDNLLGVLEREASGGLPN